MATPTVSKAVFKARVLEILRQVEATGKPVIITDRGHPVLRVEPYFGDDDAALVSLRGTVLRYDDPLGPVDDNAWEALK